MKPRPPLSVSCIAWILILKKAFVLLLAPRFSQVPTVRQALSAIGISTTGLIWWIELTDGVALISGIAMLRGRNWGRVLYLWSTPLSLGCALLFRGIRLVGVIAVIFYGVAFGILSHPSVGQFFHQNPKGSSSGK